MLPESATKDKYSAIQKAFDESHLTPQEVAEIADLHINTVRKVLRNEYVHANSLTKIERVLFEQQNSPADVVYPFGKTQSVDTRVDIATELEAIASRLDAIVTSARHDQEELMEVNINSLWTDLDRIEGSIRAIERAKERFRNRKSSR